MVDKHLANSPYKHTFYTLKYSLTLSSQLIYEYVPMPRTSLAVWNWLGLSSHLDAVRIGNFTHTIESLEGFCRFPHILFWAYHKGLWHTYIVIDFAVLSVLTWGLINYDRSRSNQRYSDWEAIILKSHTKSGEKTLYSSTTTFVSHKLCWRMNV